MCSDERHISLQHCVNVRLAQLGRSHTTAQTREVLVEEGAQGLRCQATRVLCCHGSTAIRTLVTVSRSSAPTPAATTTTRTTRTAVIPTSTSQTFQLASRRLCRCRLGRAHKRLLPRLAVTPPLPPQQQQKQQHQWQTSDNQPTHRPKDMFKES